MAYTKTIWENSPSENTPLSAENLNNIENGIENISNVTEYLNGVLGTNADVYVNIGNTLASGMIIHIIFPIIASTSDLTFSIDNGTTKKNVQCSGVNVIGTYVSGKSLDLTYDGTYWQISDICSLENRITTAEGEIDNAEAVIGNETDTYSASSTYALGSLVIYNSLLYKCTTAITVAEAWNSAKWTQVSLKDVIEEKTPTILYQNDNGTTADVTLNDDIENYKYYEVIPFGNERTSYKNKVGQSIMPNYITTDGAYCYVASEIISISGTSLTHSGSKSYYGAYSDFFQNVNTNVWYSIYQVIGYK